MIKDKILNSKFKFYIFCFIFVVFIIIAIYIGAYLIRSRQAEKVENVLGIDVSAYQGEIDWKTVESEGIYFAFIKATEGEDYLDKQFSNNWERIDETSIRKGAYLFYDFNADPNKMADFFIETVPVEKDALPPVIDVEVADGSNLPDEKTVKQNLEVVIEALEVQYKKTPIIYTNLNTYKQFIESDFPESPIWICDLSSDHPDLDKHEWKFWQYTWRGILNGIGDPRTFVDLDIYNGTLKDFYNDYDSSFFKF